MRTRARRQWIWWAGVILLLWSLFAQALLAARTASITFDEGPHLAVGYATLRTGDLRLQPVHIHPPLANVLAAAPLLLNPELPGAQAIRSIPGWEIASLSAVTDAVVWQNPHPARLALAGRLPIILLTLLGGALVLRWATDKAGAGAGLLALTLYAFDPNVVAHGSLITTDMAVTALGLLTFFLLHRYLQRPTRTRLVGVGLALGLALSSKVSAVLLLLLVGGILLLKGGRRGWRQSLGDGLVVAGIALAVLWAVYGFESRPFPAATHLEIYRSLQEHYRLGHPAFLMGQNSDHGWWYYFPVAFAVKTPLPVLVLLAAALLLFARRRRPLDLPLLLFPAVHPLTALFSSVNIGYRHLLPALPFAYILIASVLRARPRPAPSSPGRGRVAGVLCAGLVLWLVVGTLLVHPYPLTFFNRLAGGPDDGYRWLVDSNLDWGQNLWQLRDWTQAEGVGQVYYSHFSPARPDVYGVSARWLPPDPRAAPFAPLDPAPGVYAIGATTLQGVYTPDVNTFAWFRARTPVARLGHALFLYRVPPREPPAWVALCATPAPALSPEVIRSGFGRPAMRVVVLDCDQSWVYPPTGEGPAAYVLPPSAAPPPDATLKVAARHADGSPFYILYRAPRPDPWLPARTTVEGPLRYAGYRLNAEAVRAGETTELLWTVWVVEQVPRRPLSLMAHLVGPDGTPVAVADGLGLPIEQWQPGDLIVQRHRFTLPGGTPPGEYRLRIGAYWLDTLERWPVQDGQGEAGDQIDLATIPLLETP